LIDISAEVELDGRVRTRRADWFFGLADALGKFSRGAKLDGLILEYDADGIVDLVGYLGTSEAASSSQQEDCSSGVMHCGKFLQFLRVTKLELVY
jgi:hypothetical protein